MRLSLSVILIVSVLLFPAMVQAVPITFEFTGTVNWVHFDLTGAPFAKNDPICGSYTFESTTASTSGGIVGRYPGLLAFSVNYGSSYFASTSITGGEILLVNREPGEGTDSYEIVVDRATDGLSGPPVNGLALDRIRFHLSDPSFGTALDSTDLPLVPPDLSGFENKFVELYFQDDVGGGTPQSLSYGYIETLTLVPEPSTVALLSLGLVGLAAYWRKRR